MRLSTKKRKGVIPRRIYRKLQHIVAIDADYDNIVDVTLGVKHQFESLRRTISDYMTSNVVLLTDELTWNTLHIKLPSTTIVVVKDEESLHVKPTHCVSSFNDAINLINKAKLHKKDNIYVLGGTTLLRETLPFVSSVIAIRINVFMMTVHSDAYAERRRFPVANRYPMESIVLFADDKPYSYPLRDEGMDITISTFKMPKKPIRANTWFYASNNLLS